MLKRSTGLSILASTVLWASSAAADSPSQWDFNSGTLASTFGPGVMTFWDRDPNFGGQAQAVTAFGTASSFGIGLIDGVDAGVMRIAAYTEDQGLIVDHGTPSNGGGAYGNQYTLIFDIYVSNDGFLSGSGWLPFQNTNCCNDLGNDADAYIQFGAGIGISGEYSGTFTLDSWHRVAFVYDLAQIGDNHWKYIDGVLVGTQQLDGGAGLDGRWSIYTTTDPNEPQYQSFYLFTEGDTSGQYTTEAYLSSIYFTDRPLSEAEIASLGGADADGIGNPGSPCSCTGDIAPSGAAKGVVDINDLTLLLSNFGVSPADPCIDVNGSGGAIDINDLTSLLSAFGTTCP